MKTLEEYEREAIPLRKTTAEAPGLCASCIFWRVAATQVQGCPVSMQCGKSQIMGLGLSGQDGKAIITPAGFGCIWHKNRTTTEH